jgi:hypothetical protein
MQPATAIKPKKRPSKGSLPRGYKWPVSLHAAATELGCSAQHLSMVLRGDRISRSLTARYQELANRSTN